MNNQSSLIIIRLMIIIYICISISVYIIPWFAYENMGSLPTVAFSVQGACFVPTPCAGDTSCTQAAAWKRPIKRRVLVRDPEQVKAQLTVICFYGFISWWYIINQLVANVAAGRLGVLVFFVVTFIYMLRSWCSGVGWGGMLTFMYMLHWWCYVDDVQGWGGVGWDVNVHIQIQIHVNNSQKLAAMSKFFHG